jgi:hypothetical protein
MNAKMIVAAIAALTAVSTSYAAQPFGRDSVYVTPGTHVSKAAPGPAITRFGRDSVYATQTPAGKPAPTIQTAVEYKAGRA